LLVKSSRLFIRLQFDLQHLDIWCVAFRSQ
jgi:hypothetical protein